MSLRNSGSLEYQLVLASHHPIIPCLTLFHRFSNVIGIPASVAADCLLLSDVLTSSQRSSCLKFGLRTYGTLGSGKGYVSGANILGIASISIDAGILNGNTSILSDAYQRVHNEIAVRSGNTDGILADGSFNQHLGLLYNGSNLVPVPLMINTDPSYIGNYGKDL